MAQFKNSESHLKLQDSLDFLLIEESQTKLKEYVSLLSHGGEIELYGLDIDEVSRMLQLRLINIIDLNELMKNRKSFSSMESRCLELEQLGLSIIRKKINSYHYYIEARRR